jgi:hypothetical protein
MNTFKRKALFTAVVAGLGTVAGTAEAVYLNPNRTGQALVYPYYSVRASGANTWNTYLSVVNTTSRVKAVKVRFLEGKVSEEVLDFNLYLSPNDVWTAAVVPSDDGQGAKIISGDASCTSPPIPGAPKTATTVYPGGVGQPFTNIQYAASTPELGTSLDRTREGYVEMIEMATLTGSWATAVTHVATTPAFPANCNVVQAFGATPGVLAEPPTGGLTGTGTLINVNSGTDVGYKADALANWSNIAQWQDPGNVLPRLSNASPAVSVVVHSNDGVGLSPASLQITAYRNTFVGSSGASAGAQAVASVFMHAAVMNEYILDANTNSATDWIMTHPLKNSFVPSSVGATPVADPYTNVLTTQGACESAAFTIFDREEQLQQGHIGFSPSGSTTGGITGPLCWESNVVSFFRTAPASGAASSVFGSLNNLNVTVPAGFQNGWVSVSFAGAGAARGLVSSASERVDLAPAAGVGPIGAAVAGPVTFMGLPVTGFMVRTFQNNVLTCGTASCQGNYSALFDHAYRDVITP